MCIAHPLNNYTVVNYTVVMDAAPGPDSSDFNFLVDLVDNPVATQLRNDSRTRSLGENNSPINIDVRELCRVHLINFIYMCHFDFRVGTSLMLSRKRSQ